MAFGKCWQALLAAFAEIPSRLCLAHRGITQTDLGCANNVWASLSHDTPHQDYGWTALIFRSSL